MTFIKLTWEDSRKNFLVNMDLVTDVQESPSGGATLYYEEAGNEITVVQTLDYIERALERGGN